VLRVTTAVTEVDVSITPTTDYSLNVFEMIDTDFLGALVTPLVLDP